MIDDLVKKSDGILSSIVDYVRKNMPAPIITGDGMGEETEMVLPFKYYDNTNIRLGLYKNGDGKKILHDNSRVFMWLDNNGFHLSQKSRSKKYWRQINLLMERGYTFKYDEDWKWFYIDVTTDASPKKIMYFIESLQIMYCQVLSKR